LTDREQAAYMAIADFVRSEIVRTVESDLPLAKSFKDSYLNRKLDLAGYTIVGDFATVRAGIADHISVYEDMQAVSSLVDNLCQRGIDDLNGAATTFDAALLEFAVDLQRTIDYYRSRHTTYYTADDFGENGLVSLAALPEAARPYRFVYQNYYPALAEDIAYVADDYVQSNGRIYKVITGGTLSAGQLGSGLTSEDPDATETLGSLVFQFQENPVCFAAEMQPYPWKTREMLSCSGCGQLTDADVADYTPNQFISLRSSAYFYSLEPRGLAFWVSPKVRPYWQVQLEWDGLKTSFEDTDVVLYGPLEARAAAYYIRSTLSRIITESTQAANTALALFAAERKRLWQLRDEQRRVLL
jgi:hypothetical protein